MSKEKTVQLDMKWAVQCVERLGKLLNLAGLYEPENASVVKAAEDVVSVLQSAELPEGAIQLQSVNAILYINGARVKLPETLLDTAVLFRRVLEPLNVQELSFQRGVRVADLQGMVRALKSAKSKGGHSLPNALSGGAIAFRRIQTSVARKPPEELLREAYARLVVLADEVARGEVPATHRFRRVLQVIADASKGREALLVALARSDGSESLGGHHAAAVASLSLLLAREIGLPLPDQVSVAMNGALHDVSWGAQQPSFDARRLRLRSCLTVGLRLMADGSELLAEPFLVSTEAARSNRPAVGQWAAPLHAQLVGIACAFISLVKPAAPAVGLAADRAIQLLLSSERFDSRPLRLFVRIVGLLPVGSVVELARGRKGVVLTAPTDAAATQSPTVRLVGSGETIDLAKRGERVIRVLAPWEYDINPTAFVFA